MNEVTGLVINLAAYGRLVTVALDLSLIYSNVCRCIGKDMDGGLLDTVAYYDEKWRALHTALVDFESTTAFEVAYAKAPSSKYSFQEKTVLYLRDSLAVYLEESIRETLKELNFLDSGET